LSNFSPCRFWIHESVVARSISLPIGNEHGTSETLTALLFCIKKGFEGSKKHKTQVFTGHPLSDLSNEMGNGQVCYQQFGRKEPFDRGKDSTQHILRRTRWFKFGNLENTLEVGEQIDLVNEIVGNRIPSDCNEDDPTIPVFVAQRRRKQYLHFYKDTEEECISYRNYDVPTIATKHLSEYWPGISKSSDTVRRRSFAPKDLILIENDFCLIIATTNTLGNSGKLVIRDNTIYPARSTRESRTPVVIQTSSSAVRN